jgi:hypothetical protein
VLCAATQGALPDAKMSQTPAPAGAAPVVLSAAPLSAAPGTPESAPLDPELALVPLELEPVPPELELIPLALEPMPPELELVPPELELVPLELVLPTPELDVVPLEPGLVLPELALVAAPALPPPPPEPGPAPELPFVAPAAPEEGGLELPEQPPAAATARIAAQARDPGRAMKTTERKRRVRGFAAFMRERYYVQARCLLRLLLSSQCLDPSAAPR